MEFRVYSATWHSNAGLIATSSSQVDMSNFFLYSSFAGFYNRPSPFSYGKHATPKLSPPKKLSPRHSEAIPRWKQKLRVVASSAKGFRQVVEDYWWVLVRLASPAFRRTLRYLPPKTCNLGRFRLFFFPLLRRKLNGPYLKAAEQFEIFAGKISGRKIETVCEIGAGFGALAEIVIWNSSPKRYVIVDLPESLEISHAYLCWVAATNDGSNVSRTSSLDSLTLLGTEVIFVDATTFDHTQPGALRDVDLFLNSNSFGEMTAEIIESYLHLVDSQPGALLVSANRHRKEGEHFFDPFSFTAGFPAWGRVHVESQRAHKSYRRNVVTVHAVN